MFRRAVPICAKRHVAAVTMGSRIHSFLHFGNLSKLRSARYCAFLMAVVFAAITPAIIAGCGGSSGSAAVIVPSTPSISPGTGTYTGTQQVTISDATQGSTIYYTTDGTVPTASSTVYTSALSITASSTVQAIAVLGGVSSAVASSTLTINPAHPPAKLAFVQQPSNALTGIRHLTPSSSDGARRQRKRGDECHQSSYARAYIRDRPCGNADDHSAKRYCNV